MKKKTVKAWVVIWRDANVIKGKETDDTLFNSKTRQARIYETREAAEAAWWINKEKWPLVRCTLTYTEP